MAEQELNKKLAEWRWGKVYWWEELKNVSYRPVALYIGYYYVKQNIGDEKYMPVPDFTNPDFGIAYCFKWLVPKLRDVSIGYPSIVHDKPTFLASTWKAGVSYIGYDSNPALALCKAIEKLIGDKDV